MFFNEITIPIWVIIGTKIGDFGEGFASFPIVIEFCMVLFTSKIKGVDTFNLIKDVIVKSCMKVADHSAHMRIQSIHHFRRKTERDIKLP